MIKDIKKNLKVGTPIYWVNICNLYNGGVSAGVVTDIKEVDPGFFQVSTTCNYGYRFQLSNDGKKFMDTKTNSLCIVFNDELYLDAEKAEKRMNTLRKKEADKIKKQILSHQNAISALNEELNSLL